MIKAAFFDIDGTLLSFKTHQVSPGTIQAFQRLGELGIRTFISSGRPQVLIPPMPVSFQGYITMNGGYVFVGDEVLFRNPIPQEESDRWLQYVEDHNMATMAFLADAMYMNYADPAALRLRDQLEFQLPPICQLSELKGREIYQFIALMPPEQDQEVRQMLPHCRLPRWHPAFSDLIADGNSKAVGMERILSHFGLQRQECIAFGDGGNDVEMLQYAGIGVAMGNADDVVKSQADYITTSVDDEGILHALQELIPNF